MKILVIGGTQFIGPLVVRGLLARGHAVTVFHRGEHRLPTDLAGVEEVLGDARELSQHAVRLRGAGFDAVLHLVAMTRREADAAVGVFAGVVRHVVVVSSVDVYAAFGALLRKEERAPSSLPLSESSPLRTSRYLHGGEYEKIEVEEVFAARAGEFPAGVTIVRLPAVYGPGDRQHRFYPFLKRMAEKRPAILLEPAEGNFRWSHGYVENVAHALLLAVTAGGHEGAGGAKIFNVGEGPQGKTATAGERLHAMARAAKYRGQILIVPRAECPAHLVHDELDFRQDVIINDAAIRKELGYAEVVSAEEGFARTVAWELAHPPEQVDAASLDYAAEDRVLEKFGLVKKKGS